jgi:hypothetical protein
LQGDQPDQQRAQGAVDALVVVVPRLQTDAHVATGAQTTAATSGVPLQRVTNLIGKNLVGANGEEAGEIENLLIDRSGNVRAAVVAWGGFLGLGESRTLLPMDRIQLGTGDNDRARISMTREQLERLPRFDRDRTAEYGREFGWGEGLRWHR